jgi:hypothetical protein
MRRAWLYGGLGLVMLLILLETAEQSAIPVSRH